MMRESAKARAESFRYAGLEVGRDSLSAHYELDGRPFHETVSFEGVGRLDEPAPRAVAALWYLLAGLSYYKAGAAREIDLDATPIGPRGRDLLRAALIDGLGEYSYRNDLPLDDVRVVGGADARAAAVTLDPLRVLTPFGGGIDSVVTVERLSRELDQTLFVVSPATGRFDALEATAAVTGLEVARATRALDPQVVRGDVNFFDGHVPVTAMVTLLGATAAVASNRGGVAMSNEYSASAPNVSWRGRDVNHQWSKSLAAEQLLGDALGEAVGPQLVVASYLRDRSEIWVASEFSRLPAYHHAFRSCNRAFTQDVARRATTWCGQCDKCLFINLVLAPFLSRAELAAIFGAEPLADPRLADQLATLVGLGPVHKPFECVGDPDESAAALVRVANLPEWRDVAHLGALARRLDAPRSFDDLLTAQGPSRVPAHWLR
jgi:UDP-N-acetyl-alpha-D-muramoyl-L-alanyl-L-glutamate epimerase